MPAILPIGDIVIANRTRKEIKHLTVLCESLKAVGMLHPVVVNSRHELIAGSRRVEAAKRIGWTEVPVNIVECLDDAVKAILAERDENSCREPLSPSEMIEIGRRIEELEKPKAKERQGRQGRPRSGKFPEHTSKSETRDKVGEAVGVSGRTYEKARQVADAAEADPEQFGDLKPKMDAESIDSAHKELKRRKKRAAQSHDQGGEVAITQNAKDQPDESASPATEESSPDRIEITAEHEQEAKAKQEAAIHRDKTGKVIPPNLRDTFLDKEPADTLEAIQAALDILDERYQLILRSFAHKPHKSFIDFSKVTNLLANTVGDKPQSLRVVIGMIKNNLPYCVCPDCGGEGCKTCRWGGFLPQWRAEEHAPLVKE